MEFRLFEFRIFPSPRSVVLPRLKSPKPSWLNYLPTTVRRRDRFMPFPRTLAQNETQTSPFRNWTWIAISSTITVAQLSLLFHYIQWSFKICCCSCSRQCIEKGLCGLTRAFAQLPPVKIIHSCQLTINLFSSVIHSVILRANKHPK